MHAILSMQVGGAERLVSDMVRYPAFAANKPIVCCLDTIGELGEKLLQDGYTVYCKGRQPGLDMTVIGWLREIMKREHVEVVHAHQYSPLFYTVPAAFLSGRKKIVYTRWPFPPGAEMLETFDFQPLLSLGVDHLVAFPRPRLRPWPSMIIPAITDQVIHNGIDCSTMNRESNNSFKRQELGLDASAEFLDCRTIDSIKKFDDDQGLKLVLQQVRIRIWSLRGKGRT
jgi:glycosyltransferase involved in cell wall biosynthesis